MTDLESESDGSKRSIHHFSLHESEPPCMVSRRSKKSESVAFSTVEISSYPVILGDNPACSVGLPLQLDWTPHTKETYDLENFERSRGSRRREGELRIHFLTRQNWIKNSGCCSEDEMLQRRKELVKARHQREQSKRMYNWKNRITDFLCRTQAASYVAVGTKARTTYPKR